MRDIPVPIGKGRKIMNALNDFEFKQRKYMPVFPKASGKHRPFTSRATLMRTMNLCQQANFMGCRCIVYLTSSYDIFRHTRISMLVWTTLFITEKAISERSWLLMCMSSSGACETSVTKEFLYLGRRHRPLQQFLSSFQIQQRLRIVMKKLRCICVIWGVAEYFIHQPDMNRPIEFRGWRRDALGDIVEIEEDADDGLFSASLNLYFRWELHKAWELRLLRPYLPDGTAITTSMEEHHLRVAAETLVEEEAERATGGRKTRQRGNGTATGCGG